MENTHLLIWLRRQTAGIFAVEFGRHCVSWDADNQTITETDPAFPFPLPINDHTLAGLNITLVEKVYRIVLCTRAKKRKRG